MSYLHPLLSDDLFIGQLFEDDKHKIVYVDPRFLEIFNIPDSEENLTGKNSLKLFRQYSQQMIDSEKFMNSVERISHTGAVFISGKISVTDNQKIEIYFTPLISDGKRLGSLWQFKIYFSETEQICPIDDKKLLQFILDNCNDGFWCWNLKTNDIYCSDQWKKMFGYQENGVEGKTLMEKWLNKIHPEDEQKINKDMNDYLGGKTPAYQNEHRLLCKNGKYKWIYTKAKVIEWDNDGNPAKMVGILTDISARKELEELLSKSLHKEKKLNEQKSQFMSMALHEFRSPLSTILLMADSVEAYWEKMPKQKIIQKIKCIKKKVDFLTNVMEKLLNLSLTELGEIKFSPEISNFNEFLNASIEEKIEKPFHLHKIILNTPDYPVFLNIDKQLMKEVIFNVLANSMKYSSKNTTITIELKTTRSNVTVSIADQGKGIPKEETDRIFEPFYRGPNVRKIPGTGLGLALVKQFVMLHKGEITFHSKVNEGTTFFITLPKN